MFGLLAPCPLVASSVFACTSQGPSTVALKAVDEPQAFDRTDISTIEVQQVVTLATGTLVVTEAGAKREYPLVFP